MENSNKIYALLMMNNSGGAISARKFHWEVVAIFQHRPTKDELLGFNSVFDSTDKFDCKAVDLHVNGIDLVHQVYSNNKLEWDECHFTTWIKEVDPGFLGLNEYFISQEFDDTDTIVRI